MDQSTRDGITFTLGTFLTLCTILALGTKFILLPWLRDHLLTPMRETHHQVSANNHASPEPTIPDRLEDLGDKVDQATAAHDQQATDMKALANVLDQHLKWSDRWVDVVDRELQLVKDQLKQRNGEKT